MSSHLYTHAPGVRRRPGLVARCDSSPRPGRGQPRPSRPRIPNRARLVDTAGGAGSNPAQGLILSFAYLWFALLEGCKVFELRRHKYPVPEEGLRVLLVCNQRVRKQFGLSNQMAEAHCRRRLGPYTADQIISDPALRGGLLISDDAIRSYLQDKTGYLYALQDTKLSSCRWAEWQGNGSNCNNFFSQFDIQGQKRWH